MPRYGDSDYDPDFDDSPPPSPKRKAFHNASLFSKVRLRFRRSRSTILTFVIITVLIYLWTHIRLPQSKPKHAPSLNHKNIDWRMFAYSQYATDRHHLCNAVMIFEALERLGSKAERILMFPEGMDIEVSDERDRDSQLLLKAQSLYKARLLSIPTEGTLKSGKPSIFKIDETVIVCIHLLMLSRSAWPHLTFFNTKSITSLRSEHEQIPCLQSNPISSYHPSRQRYYSV